MLYYKIKIVLLFLLSEFISKDYCTLVFPSLSGSGAYGIFAAIAVPLDLPHRNVFVSYNFEANYNFPYLASDLFPGPWKRFEDEEGRNLKPTDANETEQTKTSLNNSIRTRRSLISRNSFYKVLSDKLKYHGYEGQSCILKIICEVNYYKLNENNGVIGQILHILFTPSSSKDEQLSESFYKAESDGLNSNCNIYNEICSKSLLELFSVQLEDLLNIIA